MKTIYTFALLLVLSLNTRVTAQLTATLNPVQDAYFISMGGGQGNNPIMKFDISSIPAGSTITKAILHVYVYDTLNPTQTAATSGNMMFRNLNNKQGWMETDSAYSFAPNMNAYSDTVTQLSGFGDSIGWAASANLESIVLRDFNAAHTYCTISLKDPDDVTCCGASGPGFSFFLANSPDSILIGNPMVGDGRMIFYPREYAIAQLRPYLDIDYTCVDSVMQSTSLCAGDSIVVGTSVYKTTGIYHDTLASINGCDSIVVTDLNVMPAIDVSISISGGTLTSNENGASYQWIDCNNGNSAIAAETSQAYTPQGSGNYAVVVNKNSCSDTSTCTAVVVTGVEYSDIARVSIHPNPGQGIITVELGSRTAQLLVTDMLGKIVYEAANCSGKTLIDLGREDKGVYLLKASCNGRTAFFRIIKD